jgi:hypothetical protein
MVKVPLAIVHGADLSMVNFKKKLATFAFPARFSGVDAKQQTTFLASPFLPQMPPMC